MIKKLIPLFMIMSFAIGFVAESDVFHGVEETLVKTNSVHNGTADLSLDDNCNDKDCHKREEHCSHHCSGVHSVTQNINTINISTSIGQNSKLRWYYFNKYQTLNSDPALRPPALS